MNKEEAVILLTDVYNELSDVCGDLEELERFYKKLDKVIDWLERSDIDESLLGRQD